LLALAGSFVGGAVLCAAAEARQAGSSVSSGSISLRNADHTLGFDAKTGRLRSFRSQLAPDQEFIESAPDDPVFVIQYLDGSRRFRQITSAQARSVDVDGSAADRIAVTFRDLAGIDLHVSVQVRTSPDGQASLWGLSIRNDAGLFITDVQFPFVVVSYRLKGKPGSEALLRPFRQGELIVGPRPQDLEPDSPHAWQMLPENGGKSHYPGMTFAQFLAYYNDRAGILISCRDATGAIKLIKPVHHGTGLRLGVAHVGDWPATGARTLEYEVVLQSFRGDWYDAAALYRVWALEQPWARTPLARRTDVPAWLLESPPHIMVRMAGELDFGPAPPNQEFLPYPKLLALLGRTADAVGASIVPVLMAWERPGPWIYPDSFPPVGGEASLAEFADRSRKKGWHVGSFASGTRWITAHHWTGYDGDGYFDRTGGEPSISRTHRQELWREPGDQLWRPSYLGCMAVSMTRELALGFVRKLTGYGLDWIQFLDQNVNGGTYPCFSPDHGHPPAPGRWMTATMQELLDSFRRLGDEVKASSGGSREVVFSVELPPNEFLLPYFQVCDARVVPPGHAGAWRGYIPLYHFLYHEFVLMEGGFGQGPEPFHLPIRNAYNLVVGEIPGGALTGDGTLLNRDTTNWAPWRPPVGSSADALEVIRTATALRRGKGRDFLVFGRMLRPSVTANIQTVRWLSAGIEHRIPAVFHAVWQAPSGRLGAVFANWTNAAQAFTVADHRLGSTAVLTVSGRRMDSRTMAPQAGRLDVTLPPLACAVIESGPSRGVAEPKP
jgi:hypothetical protein